MTLGQKATEPCPFCGSTDILSLMYPMAGWLARCDNCNAQIDGKYWNTRADAALPAQVVTDEGVKEYERGVTDGRREALEIASDAVHSWGFDSHDNPNLLAEQIRTDKMDM